MGRDKPGTSRLWPEPSALHLEYQVTTVSFTLLTADTATTQQCCAAIKTMKSPYSIYVQISQKTNLLIFPLQQFETIKIITHESYKIG